MAPQLEVRPEAQDDIEAGALWYEAQKDGLGARFVAICCNSRSLSRRFVADCSTVFPTPSTSWPTTKAALSWRSCTSIAIQTRGAIASERAADGGAHGLTGQ
jgi:hypothetical protein